MHATRSFILVLLLFAAVEARAQKEANIWYFGHGAGIDFNGAEPRPLADGVLRQREGCASIADPVTGALLFYTDGVTVWNRDHEPMPNGTGLLGHDDATQSALIVPAPCSVTRFYVFTADAGPLAHPPGRGINYSVVDMDRDGGRGDVVEKNVPLYAPATEKLTAVRHANGVDVWIVTHEWGSSRFRSYLLTENGLDASLPRTPSTGETHNGLAEFAIGYLKASPDGRMIVSVVGTSVVELFDFNRDLGVLGNPRRLSSRSKYGVSFSPDSRLLYVVERRPGWSYDTLYQYDVTLGSEAAILASRIAVAAGDFWALQNAPDGRIYVANNSYYLKEHLGWLGTIDNPNVRGAGCEFDPRGFRLEVAGTTPVVTEGLPNMIESFGEGLVRACGPPDAQIAFIDETCAGACIALRDSSRNLPTSWEWRIEGARPGTSTEQHPSLVCFDEPGLYTVTLIASNSFGSDRAERTIVVRGAGDVQATAGVAVVAPGDTATIPVFVEAIEARGPIEELTIRLGYDSTTMRPVGLDAGGAMLAGWVLVLDDDTASSTLTVRATAPAGTSLAGAGRLLSFRFATWLATTATTSLPLALDVPASICGTVPARAGRLDFAICGLQGRLIELDTSTLVLRAIVPNPSAGSSAIRFATPVDGPVRAAVHDASGREVALLHDGVLPEGEHVIVWTSGALPAGAYQCRIVADGRVVSMPLLLTR